MCPMLTAAEFTQYVAEMGSLEKRLEEARKLLRRYREKNTECISSPEWAGALETVLRALDGQ